jgi:hypothetical protein
MRIFVQPPEIGGSLNNVAQQAHNILRKAGIASTRLGGIINDQGVVLVDSADVPGALKVLTRAGLRAVADHNR